MNARTKPLAALIVLIALAIMILALLAGSPVSTGSTMSGTQDFNKICIDGVEYLYLQVSAGPGYLAPHFKPDGTLYLCEDAGEGGR